MDGWMDEPRSHVAEAAGTHGPDLGQLIYLQVARVRPTNEEHGVVYHSFASLGPVVSFQRPTTQGALLF